jgi:hypothetical protein
MRYLFFVGAVERVSKFRLSLKRYLGSLSNVDDAPPFFKPLPVHSIALGCGVVNLDLSLQYLSDAGRGVNDKATHLESHLNPLIAAQFVQRQMIECVKGRGTGSLEIGVPELGKGAVVEAVRRLRYGEDLAVELADDSSASILNSSSLKKEYFEGLFAGSSCLAFTQKIGRHNGANRSNGLNPSRKIGAGRGRVRTWQRGESDCEDANANEGTGRGKHQAIDAQLDEFGNFHSLSEMRAQHLSALEGRA